MHAREYHGIYSGRDPEYVQIAKYWSSSFSDTVAFTLQTALSNVLFATNGFVVLAATPLPRTLSTTWFELDTKKSSYTLSHPWATLF